MQFPVQKMARECMTSLTFWCGLSRRSWFSTIVSYVCFFVWKLALSMAKSYPKNQILYAIVKVHQIVIICIEIFRQCGHFCWWNNKKKVQFTFYRSLRKRFLKICFKWICKVCEWGFVCVCVCQGGGMEGWGDDSSIEKDLSINFLFFFSPPPHSLIPPLSV